MNCSKCQSLRISTIICESEEAPPKLDEAKKVNPPNAIDRWLWSHGFQAMSGAAAVDAMQAEK